MNDPCIVGAVFTWSAPRGSISKNNLYDQEKQLPCFNIHDAILSGCAE
jgi:hypothetical protein